MKLNTKVRLLAGAVALAGVAHIPQASATNLGTIGVPASSFAGNFAFGPGFFSDWYDFQVAGLASLIATGNSATFAGGTAGTQLTSFDLYEGNHTTWIASGTITPTPLGGGVTFYSSLIINSPLLANHAYSLEVNGNAYSPDRTNNYSLSLSTAPVPEPGTYAMMLSGLGLMGFMLRRRRMS